MKFSDIMATVRSGIQYVEGMLPIAKIIGGPMVATVVKAVEAVTETVNNVETRIQEGAIVATSKDAVTIKEMTERLAKVNDELAEYIETHP